MDFNNIKRNITPEKAMAILQKEGLNISPEDGGLAVELLYFLALLFYKQYGSEL
ncbi:hypothetical protein [Mucilaginibacter sp.]|uniref:hypothetical protein n=1 Tax=Mucilaginibacter sp. TaxID=1882438 RepID=UPI003264037A